MRDFLLRWGCNICEFVSQFHKPDFGSLPISIVSIEIIAEDFDFRLDLHKFISCHRDNVVLQEFLLPVLRFLELPGLLKFLFLFLDEGSQHMTLAKSQLEVRHRSVWVLVPEINVIEDQLWIQKQRHICTLGSSGPDLPISDDFSKFFIISFVFFRRHLEGGLLLVRTWARASSSSGLCLQQRGSC